jgi:hypothetical protein
LVSGDAPAVLTTAAASPARATPFSNSFPVSSKVNVNKGSVALLSVGGIAFAFGAWLCGFSETEINLLTGSVSTTHPYLAVGVVVAVLGVLIALYARYDLKRNGTGTVARQSADVGGVGLGGRLGQHSAQQQAPPVISDGGWECLGCGKANRRERSGCWWCGAQRPETGMSSSFPLR